MDGLYTLIEITKKHFYNLKILPIQKKNLTSINFNLDLFLFPYVNKTTWKMSSVHKYTCALGIFLKNHKNMVRLYMSLCQITGSCGPYRCNARAEDKFQKVCSLTNPPPPPPPRKKDIYVPTPIGTFPFMSGSPFSFSDNDTLCLRSTLYSSVLLIFTFWVWRLIDFASSVLSLTISRWRSTFWATNLWTVLFSVSSSFCYFEILSNCDCMRYRTSSPACSFFSWNRLFDVR